MSIMQSGMIGIAATISTLKEKRILKRLSATPLPIWKFLLAEVLAHLVSTIIQILLVLFIGLVMFGGNVYGSLPFLILVGFIGNFVFLNIGFIIAAISKTSQSAQSLASGMTTPMMFLSGVFFSREDLPDGVRKFAEILPLSPLIDSLRAISLKGAGITDLKSELFLIMIWTLLTFAIASKVFKFREE
ncbi:MAG: ABC transporter permease [Candidatus Dojkabacteria bacterium]|nr:ABC transporter permease [Candidatus Dojkabacteria bacterium]